MSVEKKGVCMYVYVQKKNTCEALLMSAAKIAKRTTQMRYCMDNKRRYFLLLKTVKNGFEYSRQ